MSDGAVTLRRGQSNPAWQANVSADLQPVAEQIWKLVSKGPVELSSLFRQCSFAELKIYETVDELVESQHLELSPVGARQKECRGTPQTGGTHRPPSRSAYRHHSSRRRLSHRNS
jgi:hypothetical protein